MPSQVFIATRPAEEINKLFERMAVRHYQAECRVFDPTIPEPETNIIDSLGSLDLLSDRILGRVNNAYRFIFGSLSARATTVTGYKRVVNDFFSGHGHPNFWRSLVGDITTSAGEAGDYINNLYTVRGQETPAPRHENAAKYFPLFNPVRNEWVSNQFVSPTLLRGVDGETYVPREVMEAVDGNYVPWDNYVEHGYSMIDGDLIPSDQVIEVEDQYGDIREVWSEGSEVFEYMGRYYDFDRSVYRHRLLGGGYITDADTPHYTDLGNGTYLSNDYEPMRHDTSVLDYFDGFKATEGEDIVTGSRIHASNTLFMGVELEVENHAGNRSTRSLARDMMVALAGEGIVVRDGSLSDGFEIVSIPATLNYHYDIWKRVCFSEARKDLVSYDSTNCGMHVHMSKEAFSDYALGMFITFINSESNSAFMDVIANRTSNSYCQRTPSKVTRGKSRHAYMDARGGRHDKYWATNLLNSATVEVRIFKGNLAYSAVMANLEFCHALHRYVTHYASHRKLAYTDFIAWFTDTKIGCRKSYPFLFEYLRARGYVKYEGKGYTTNAKSTSDKGGVAPDREVTCDPVLLKLHQRASNASRSTKLA